MTRRAVAVAIVALLATMSLASVAVAAESDDVEGAIVTPQVIVDEENGLILIGLPVDGELPECATEETNGPDEDAAADGHDGDDDGDEADSYGPGDCIEIVIEHPSGKTHHGAIVSSVAKNLHPSMLDGIKKGEIMRWVAKNGGVEDGETVETRVKPEKKDKSEKAAKPAKDKSDRGPKNKADHPGKGKAKGKGK